MPKPALTVEEFVESIRYTTYGSEDIAKIALGVDDKALRILARNYLTTRDGFLKELEECIALYTS